MPAREAPYPGVCGPHNHFSHNWCRVATAEFPCLDLHVQQWGFIAVQDRGSIPPPQNLTCSWDLQQLWSFFFFFLKPKPAHILYLFNCKSVLLKELMWNLYGIWWYLGCFAFWGLSRLCVPWLFPRFSFSKSQWLSTHLLCEEIPIQFRVLGNYFKYLINKTQLWPMNIP